MRIFLVPVYIFMKNHFEKDLKILKKKQNFLDLEVIVICMVCYQVA